MTLAHTLDDVPLREDLSRLLAAAPVPPRSPGLEADTSRLAGELARAWAGAPLPAGARVGPYTLERVLGQGGQGTVYLAHDAQGRPVALKVPRSELVSRLIREAQILFHLDHPRVVRIEKAAFKDEPIPYVATEYLAAGSLADLLEREPGGLPPARVAQLADEVLEALAYAHEKGVVHRDLKPSNILFDEQGRVKVADFGIGSLGLLEGRRVEGTLCSLDRTVFAGTPAYMAPEQEHIEEPLDGRADQYGLGKVLYQALTGRSPRTVRSLAQVPGLGPAWDAFLFRLLEDRPEDRFPSAAAAREELAALAGRPAGPAVNPLLVELVEARRRLTEQVTQLNRELQALQAERVVAGEDGPGIQGVARRAAALAVEAVERLRADGRAGLIAFPADDVWRRWRQGAALEDVHELSVRGAGLADMAARGGVVIRRHRVAVALAPLVPPGGPQLSEAARVGLYALCGQALPQLRARSLFLLDREGHPWLHVGEDAGRDLTGEAAQVASACAGGAPGRGFTRLTRPKGEDLLVARVGVRALLAARVASADLDAQAFERAVEPLVEVLDAALRGPGVFLPDLPERPPAELELELAARLERRALELCAEEGIALLVSPGGTVALGQHGRLRTLSHRALPRALGAALGIELEPERPPPGARPARRVLWGPAVGLCAGLLLGTMSPAPPLAAVVPCALLVGGVLAGVWAGRRAGPRWSGGAVTWALLILLAALGAVGLPVSLDLALRGVGRGLPAWSFGLTALVPLATALGFCLTLAAALRQRARSGAR